MPDSAGAPDQAITDRLAGQTVREEHVPAVGATPSTQPPQSANEPIVIEDDDDDDDDDSGGGGNTISSNNNGGAGSRQEGRPPDPAQSCPTIAVKDAMDRCLKRFSERVEDASVHLGQPDVAKSRYGILQTACMKGDLFYILFHKLFCLWTLDPERALEPLSAISNTAVTSFTVLLSVFRNNSEIPHDHLAWFANFPEFLPQVDGYHHALQRLSTFLSLFATRWIVVAQQIASRGYPLLAGESLVSLQCASDTLSGVLFTLSRRTIGIPDGPTASQLTQLFTADLATERGLARLPGATQTAHKTRAAARQRMVDAYRNLINQPDNQQPPMPPPQQPVGQPQPQPQPQPQQPSSPQQQRQNQPQQHQPQRPQQLQYRPPPQHQLSQQVQPQHHPQQQQQHQQHLPQQQYLSQQQHLPQQQHQSQQQTLQSQHRPHQRQMSQQGQQQQMPQQQPSAYQLQLQQQAHLVHQMHQQLQLQHLQQQSQARMRAHAQAQALAQAQQRQQQQQEQQEQQQQQFVYQSPSMTNMPNYQALSNFNQSPAPTPSSQMSFQGQAYPAGPYVDMNAQFSQQAPPLLAQPALGLVTNGMASPTTPASASYLQYSAGNQGRWPIAPAPIPSPSPTGLHSYQYLNGRVQSPASPQGPQTAQAFPPPYNQPIAQGSHPQPARSPFAHPVFQPAMPTPLLPQNRLVSSPVVLTPQGQSPNVLQSPQGDLATRAPPSRQPSAGSTAAQGVRPSRSRSSSEQFTTRVLHVHEHPTGAHDATSLQAGLHLVNWRSPKRAPAHLAAQPKRYYQFVDSFAAGPEQILPQMKIIKLQFELSPKEATNIPELVVPNELQQDLFNELPVSRYFNGCHRYRLRICRRYDGQTTLSGPSWAVSRTCWPSHIHVIFNQRPQTLRRKQHFHHDQPIELTDLLVPGLNEIDISFPVYPQNSQPSAVNFAAVERISTIDHETVWALVNSHQHIGTEETKSVIMRRMSASESDDLVVENDSLRVSVVDPFSYQMYVVPVRGVECKHLECLDLQNWLETRPRKFPTEPTEPTVVDCWSCPICGLDARPTSLRIDDFFVDVRQKLLEGGKESTKAIEVAADGSWKAVPEVVSDSSPELAHRDIKHRESSRSSVGLTASVPETIEILDDD